MARWAVALIIVTLVAAAFTLASLAVGVGLVAQILFYILLGIFMIGLIVRLGAGHTGHWHGHA